MRIDPSDLGVEGLSKGAVEVVAVRSGVDRTEIITVVPVALGSKLLLNALVEDSAREWIGDGDADIVGLSFANECYGLKNLGPAFAGITELEEETGSDVRVCKSATSRVNGREGEALVHGVEYLLRTGLDSHPDLRATGAFECINGGFR
jgi:hypothetical protein